jgi:hypothetical protein
MEAPEIAPEDGPIVKRQRTAEEQEGGTFFGYYFPHVFRLLRRSRGTAFRNE